MSEQISVRNNNSNKNQNSQTQKDYTDYENLLPFPPNTNYILLIKSIINTFKKKLAEKSIREDKQVQQEILIAIENLRSARKYQHKLFENIMNCISESFKDKLIFLDNNRIILNALVLICEIFSEFELKSQRKWIFDFLSLALVYKFGYINNPEIIEIANVILTKFAKTPAYPETFEVLTEIIQYNTDEEAEVCESLFNDFIKGTSPQTLCTFNLNYMMNLFNDMPVSLDNLRIEMINRCFKGFKEKLSEQQFDVFVSFFSEENKNLFLGFVNLK